MSVRSQAPPSGCRRNTGLDVPTIANRHLASSDLIPNAQTANHSSQASLRAVRNPIYALTVNRSLHRYRCGMGNHDNDRSRRPLDANHHRPTWMISLSRNHKPLFGMGGQGGCAGRPGPRRWWRGPPMCSPWRVARARNPTGREVGIKLLVNEFVIVCRRLVSFILTPTSRPASSVVVIIGNARPLVAIMTPRPRFHVTQGRRLRHRG